MAQVRDYTRIDNFVQHAIDIANDDSHGYSQYHRWGPDYDCSSMMYECAYYAGYDVSREDPRYTGAMIEDFTAAGYRCDAFDGNLYDLEKGDILLNTGAHTAVYIGGGQIAEASIDEYGGIAGNNYGDQTGQEIHIRSVYNYPWTHVLTPPADYITTEDTKLYGIDVSSHQPGNICSIVPNDFAIVKMSGNPQSYDWDYINPKAEQQAREAYSRHGCVGLYHFTWGKDANTEADFFVNNVRNLGYLGKAILVIDYEAEAINLGREWVRAFADRIKATTNVTPVIYSSGSVVVSQDLFGLGYPIWLANYSRGYDRINGYDDDSCTMYGGCENALLWQFTSSGFLDGYGDALDLDVFFGSKSDWQKLAAIDGSAPEPGPAPSPSGNAPESISYAVKTAQDGWLPFVNDLSDYAGEPGHAAIYLAVNMHGHGWYQVKSQRNGWLEPVRNCDINDYEYGCAGDGSPILAVRVYYETQEPNKTGWWRAKYRTANLNAGYYDWQFDDETGGGQDGYAGDGRNAIDRIQITLAR